MKLLPILLCLALAAAMLACISSPDVDDYKGRPNVCLDFARCLYYNQKNPDKSVCATYAKECAAYERMIFCRDEKNRPDGITFQSCWDKIQ
jgi:hypothetical protein